MSIQKEHSNNVRSGVSERYWNNSTTIGNNISLHCKSRREPPVADAMDIQPENPPSPGLHNEGSGSRGQERENTRRRSSNVKLFGF
jgi:hypothetical protein